MLLSIFSSDALNSILVFLSSAVFFVSNITVPGTNISFLTLFSMVLLFTVFIWAFRKMLGIESGYIIRDLHKPKHINNNKNSSKNGGH